MTEAAFPLLGAAFIVLIVLPACALLAKLGLVLIERRQQGGTGGGAVGDRGRVRRHRGRPCCPCAPWCRRPARC